MIFLKIKGTKSLCPECGKTLDAEVFNEGGKVYIKKTCDEHGEFVNTYWSDDEIYERVNKFEPSVTSVENPCVDDVHHALLIAGFVPNMKLLQYWD